MLLNVYGEIIVEPRFLAGGCRACEAPPPKPRSNDDFIIHSQ